MKRPHVILSRKDGEESQIARVPPLRPFGVFAPQGDVGELQEGV